MNHSGFPVKAIRKASTHLTEEGRFLTRECVLKRSVSVGGVQPVKTESAFGIASFLGRKGGLLAPDDMAKPVERELRIGDHAR